MPKQHVLQASKRFLEILAANVPSVSAFFSASRQSIPTVFGTVPVRRSRWRIHPFWECAKSPAHFCGCYLHYFRKPWSLVPALVYSLWFGFELCGYIGSSAGCGIRFVGPMDRLVGKGLRNSLAPSNENTNQKHTKSRQRMHTNQGKSFWVAS